VSSPYHAVISSFTSGLKSYCSIYLSTRWPLIAFSNLLHEFILPPFSLHTHICCCILWGVFVGLRIFFVQFYISHFLIHLNFRIRANSFRSKAFFPSQSSWFTFLLPTAAFRFLDPGLSIQTWFFTYKDVISIWNLLLSIRSPFYWRLTMTLFNHLY